MSPDTPAGQRHGESEEPGGQAGSPSDLPVQTSQGPASTSGDDLGLEVDVGVEKTWGVVDLRAFQRLRSQVEQLEKERELWQHRAMMAEALSQERATRLEELQAKLAQLEASVTEPEVRYTVVRVPVSRDRIVSLDEQVPQDRRTPPRGWLRRMLEP